MRSSALLLCGVTLTAFIAAAVVTALASFGAQVLPQGVHRQLARSGGMSMTVIGLVDAEHAAADTAAIRARARAALDGVPYQLDSAVWSDPLVITAPDGRRGPGAEVASPDRITANASLVAGTWPGWDGRPWQPGQPVPAALPVTVASQFLAGPGAVLAVRDSNTGAGLRLRVSGVYRRRDPDAPYWSLDAIWTCGARVPGCFTAGGPVVVNPGAFAGGGFTVDQASWVLVPDAGRIPAGDLGGLADRIQGAGNFLQGSAALGGLVVTSGIPAALTSAAAELTAARSLLAVGIALLFLPAAGALVLAARLLAAHREEEHAVARARGADWRALAVPALAEALGVGGAGTVAGVLAGARLAVPLASTGILNGDGLILSGIPPRASLWLGAGVLVLCAVTMTWPTLRARPPGVVAVRRGRQAALAGAAVAGADLALLALAAVAVWQLRSYSASGGTGIDPVVAVAPALALAAVSLIPVRLLPPLSRGLARVAAGSRRLGGAMAGWEISRLPVRRAGPVLLTVLAVATGTLALAEYQSWRQSAQDQASFAVGADMRIDTPLPVPLGAVTSITRAPGVTAAMPVASVNLGSGSLLAVDARAAQDTVLLRPDLSPLPSGALWRQIMRSTAAAGEALPWHPLRLDITASLTPLGGGVSFPASALVADSLGDVFSVPAGNLPADGRPHALAVSLSAGRPAASYPLRLIGLEAGVPGSALAPLAAHPARLAVHGVAASASAAGPFPVPLAGGPPEAWRLSASPGTGTLAVTMPGPAEVSGVATSAFLRANNVTVGSTYPAAVGAVSVPVKIVAEVSAFPTVTGADGGLITDQSAVQDYLAANAQQPLQVTSWWLRTSGAALPAVPAGAVVTDRSAQAAGLLGDSLSAAPQQAGLAIALVAALLAVMGFAASVAASLRDRRTRRALLNALGVPMFAQARQLCLEELVLSVPAAVAGLLAGIGLARLIIAAVVLTPDGASPVPPVLVRIPLGWAAGLAAAACVVAVLAALATAAQRPDTAALLRGAEAA